MNIGGQVSVCPVLSVLLGVCLGVGWLGHTLSVFNFSRNALQYFCATRITWKLNLPIGYERDFLSYCFTKYLVASLPSFPHWYSRSPEFQAQVPDTERKSVLLLTDVHSKAQTERARQPMTPQSRQVLWVKSRAGKGDGVQGSSCFLRGVLGEGPAGVTWSRSLRGVEAMLEQRTAGKVSWEVPRAQGDQCG